MTAPVKLQRPGRLPAEMNSYERAFAEYLDAEGIFWRFQCITFRLAKATTYTPDFYTIGDDGSVTIYEVKGFWREKNRIKLKCAADAFPEYRFIACTKVAKKLGGGWQFEDFRSRWRA